MDNRKRLSSLQTKLLNIPSSLHKSIRTSLASVSSVPPSRHSSASRISPRTRPDQQLVDLSGDDKNSRSNRMVDTWDVYLCNRALQSLGSSFYQSLPASIKEELRDVGLCHYMVVLRRTTTTQIPKTLPNLKPSLSPGARRLLWGAGDSRLHAGTRDLAWSFVAEEEEEGCEETEEEVLIQFDFGPRGLDIVWNSRESEAAVAAAESRSEGEEERASGRSSDLSLSSLSSSFPPTPVAWQDSTTEHLWVAGMSSTSQQPGSLTESSSISITPQVHTRSGRRATGEVREERLQMLPPTSEYMGTAKLSLEDIRTFNQTLDWDYVLNRNDCRHYADALMEHMIGVDRACARFMRSRVQQRLKERNSPLPEPLLYLAQLALEKDNSDLLMRLRASLSLQSQSSSSSDSAEDTQPKPSKALGDALRRLAATRAAMSRQRNASLDTQECMETAASTPSLQIYSDDSLSQLKTSGSATSHTYSRQRSWTKSLLASASVAAAAVSGGMLISRYLRRWAPSRDKRSRPTVRIHTGRKVFPESPLVSGWRLHASFLRGTARSFIGSRSLWMDSCFPKAANSRNVTAGKSLEIFGLRGTSGKNFVRTRLEKCQVAQPRLSGYGSQKIPARALVGRLCSGTGAFRPVF